MNEKPMRGAADAPPANTPKTEVGAVVNAIRILKYLASLNGPEGVTAVARATGISPSTTFNILRTLHAQEIVSLDPAAKTYQLGIGLAEIIGGVIAMSPFQLIQPELDRISDASGGQAVLWRRSEGDWVAVATGRMRTPVRVETGLGVHIPLHGGAVGRMTAAAAGLDRKALKKIHATLDFENPPPLEDYLAQIAQARENGWALDDSQTYLGVTGVAAVILDRQRQPQFGISTVFLTQRRDLAQLAEVGADLRQTCARISSVLYRG
jgi:DNA-binding IclR family transcriptional regulator